MRTSIAMYDVVMDAGASISHLDGDVLTTVRQIHLRALERHDVDRTHGPMTMIQKNVRRQGGLRHEGYDPRIGGEGHQELYQYVNVHPVDPALHYHTQRNGAFIPDRRINGNEHTVPTALTFNAVMRCAARCSIPEDDATPESRYRRERLRDAMISAAFTSYDVMLRTWENGSDRLEGSHDRLDRVAFLGRHDGRRGPPRRNAATVAYLLDVVAQCLPPSKTRGNIAYALFHAATVEERIFDDTVLDALERTMTHRGSNGADFDAWWNDLSPKMRLTTKQKKNHPVKDDDTPTNPTGSSSLGGEIERSMCNKGKRERERA